MENTFFTVTSSSGFEYKIDKDNMDDMEIFEDLMVMEDPEEPQVKRTMALNRVFQKVLGKEQKEKLDAFLKERDGKVRISVYQKEIGEVFAAMNESKKK